MGVKKTDANIIKEGEEEDEQDTKNKIFRNHLEKFLVHQSGSLIPKLLGIFSVVTSFAFIWLSHQESYDINKDCKVYYDQFTKLSDEYIAEFGEEAYDDLQFGTTMGPHGEELYYVKLWRDIILPDPNIPRCDEYYYSRMPHTFEYIDLGVGLIFVIHYMLLIFIAQNRCQYFISNDSLIELSIILPIFIFRYDCG